LKKNSSLLQKNVLALKKLGLYENDTKETTPVHRVHPEE